MGQPIQVLGASLGFSQRNIPTPLKYRIFANILIVGLPLTSGLLHTLKVHALTSDVLGNIDAIFLWVAGLAKGLGTLLGNGQRYTPSNDAVIPDAAKTTTDTTTK